MANYIDGYAFPIPRDRLDNYKQLAEQVARIWKEYGALEYSEYVGDDLNIEGVGNFPDLLSATEDDVIVFGWVAFESRESRDRAHAKVASDPRMNELVESADSGFEAHRMACAGFRSLV